MIEQLVSQSEQLTGTGRWRHGVNHDSLVVDTEKNMFYWNSRGIRGDSYIWLTEVVGLTPIEARATLKSLKFSGDFIVHQKHGVDSIVVYPKLIDIFHSALLEQTGFNYFSKRGISLETVKRYKLGYYNGYATIPIYNDGMLKNFQLRRDLPEKSIQYYYKTKEALVFNVDILSITNTIIITEGLTGALRLLQEGIPCVAGTSGAGGFNEAWAKYFVHQKNIYIVYDNDTAGIKGAKRVAEILGVYRCHIYNFEGKTPRYDVADYLNEGNRGDDLVDLLKSSSKLAFE